MSVSGPSHSPLSELGVEPGATLTISNTLWIGYNSWQGWDADKCTLRGNVEIVNNENNGLVLGGYNSASSNSYGVLDIDGGSLMTDLSYFRVGNAGTGLITIRRW